MKRDGTMKNNTKYVFGFLLLGFCFSLSNCKKTEINTIVRGIVFDSVKNKLVANQRVGVFSCYSFNYRRECGNLIASTTTNSRGEFEIGFEAKKNVFGFQVWAVFDSNYYYSASPPEEIIALQENYFTLYAREISILKLNLKVLNNPLYPLMISSGNSYFTIDGSSVDTTFYFRVLPKSETKIIYTVWDPSVNNNRRIYDTLNLRFQDTTALNKLIYDTRNMPVY